MRKKSPCRPVQFTASAAWYAQEIGDAPMVTAPDCRRHDAAVAG